jgi:hypothetical protein
MSFYVTNGIGASFYVASLSRARARRSRLLSSPRTPQPPTPNPVPGVARCIGLIESFESQNISNALWAFATLAIPPKSELVSLLLVRAAHRMHTFKAQEIGNTTWALASLGIQVTLNPKPGTADPEPQTPSPKV